MTADTTTAIAGRDTEPGHAKEGPLRLILAIDGISTGLSGIALLPLAGVLAEPLGLPGWLLLAAGVFFLAFGAFALTTARRRVLNRPAVVTVIAVNLLAVAETALVLLADWFPITTLGTVSLIVLAVIVLVAAELQLLGLRRVRRS